MGFIKVAVDDAKEPEVAPEGAYDLQIHSQEDHTSAKGNESIHCIILILDHPEFNPVHHYVSLPKDGEDADKTKFKLLLMKRFLVLFGIEYDAEGFDSEALVGATAQNVLLTQSENPNNPGQFSNQITLPRLQD